MNFQDEIINLLTTIKKEGIENLIKFLKGSTFFTDPASVLSHENYEGGLAKHSFIVYENLDRFCKDLPDYENVKTTLADSKEAIIEDNA